jgi:hypothetical protein
MVKFQAIRNRANMDQIRKPMGAHEGLLTIGNAIATVVDAAHPNPATGFGDALDLVFKPSLYHRGNLDISHVTPSQSQRSGLRSALTLLRPDIHYTARGAA